MNLIQIILITLLSFSQLTSNFSEMISEGLVSDSIAFHNGSSTSHHLAKHYFETKSSGSKKSKHQELAEIETEEEENNYDLNKGLFKPSGAQQTQYSRFIAPNNNFFTALAFNKNKVSRSILYQVFRI